MSTLTVMISVSVIIDGALADRLERPGETFVTEIVKSSFVFSSPSSLFYKVPSAFKYSYI